MAELEAHNRPSESQHSDNFEDSERPDSSLNPSRQDLEPQGAFPGRAATLEKIRQDERLDAARERLIDCLKDERISKYLPDVKANPEKPLEDILQGKTLEEITWYAREHLSQADSTDLMRVELDYGPGFLAFLFLDSTSGQMPLFAANSDETQNDYAAGSEFGVDFRGNDLAETEIGAGDILPAYVRFIVVRSSDGEEWIGERGLGSAHSGKRVGYFNVENGDYIAIFSKDIIRIPTNDDFQRLGVKDSTLYSDDASVQRSSKEEYDVKTSYIHDMETEQKQYAERREIQAQDFTGYFNEYFETNVSVSGQLESGLEDAAIREMASKLLNNSSQDIDFFVQAFKANRDIESRQNYGILGQAVVSRKYMGQRALGAYQIMPGNWVSWSHDAIGKSLLDGQDIVKSEHFDKDIALPSAKNQDILALVQLAEIMNHYSPNRSRFSDQDIAAMMSVCWYGNMANGRPESPEDISTTRARISVNGRSRALISPREHADKFVASMFGGGNAPKRGNRRRSR